MIDGHYFQKTVEMWTRHTTEDFSNSGPSISDELHPGEWAGHLDVVDIWRSLCTVEYQLTFVAAAASCVN